MEAFCTTRIYPPTQLDLSPVKSLVPIGGWVDPMVQDSTAKSFKGFPPPIRAKLCQISSLLNQGMVSISNAEASVAKLRAHGCEVQFSNYQGGVG